MTRATLKESHYGFAGHKRKRPTGRELHMLSIETLKVMSRQRGHLL